MSGEQNTPLSNVVSSCHIMVLADLEADYLVELLCFGARFPSELRVFHAGLPFMHEVSDLHVLPTEMKSSQQDLSAAVRHVCVGNFNGDRLQDFVLASDDAGLLLALSETIAPMRFAPRSLSSVGVSSVSVICADIDNDGDLDILSVLSGESGISLYYNQDQRGSFVHSMLVDKSFQGKFAALGSAVADYDLDGWLDLLVVSQRGVLQLYRNIHSKSNPKVSNWLAEGLVDRSTEQQHIGKWSRCDNHFG